MNLLIPKGWQQVRSISSCGTSGREGHTQATCWGGLCGRRDIFSQFMLISKVGEALGTGWQPPLVPGASFECTYEEVTSWKAQWHRPIIQATQELRQEDHKFNARLWNSARLPQNKNITVNRGSGSVKEHSPGTLRAFGSLPRTSKIKWRNKTKDLGGKKKKRNQFLKQDMKIE